MANQGQRDELESVKCIYSGSEDVQLELPQTELEGHGDFDLRVAARVVGGSPHRELELVVWLPASYLADGTSDEPPWFELASACLQHPQLHTLSDQINALIAECHGNPVLFECIEWLRTESWAFLDSATLAAEDQERDPEAASEHGDGASEHSDAAAAAQTCVNCACALAADSQFSGGCGHALCGQCLGDVVQVHRACGTALRCPLPDCSAQLPKDVTDSARAPRLWAIVSLHLRGTPFEQSVVYCPRCEDRGMDIPVLTSTVTGEDSFRLCQCFQCSSRFCDICRSPWHPGQSCFDDESRVIRMAKRRPPLTSELAEVAARVAEEARQREKAKAEMLRESLATGPGGFNMLRESFLHIHIDAIMRGLGSVLEGHVTLAPASIAPAVQKRFMSAVFGAPDAELRPAFHGTDVRNHESIFMHGLLVPGERSDIKVVHGQAHGRGIYTANVDAAWLSKGFCTHPIMLVCAVLDSAGVVRHVGDAMVVAQSDHVVPLFEGASDSFCGTCNPSGPSRWAPPSAARGPLTAVPATAQPTVAKAASMGKHGKPVGASKASQAGAPSKDRKNTKFLAHLAVRAKRY